MAGSLIQAQDWYSVRDYSKADCHAIRVREPKPVRYKTGECVTIGRELCLPAITFFPPSCDLCAEMAKELDCEGRAGTARAVWCTHRKMDSEVWVSLTQGGPYTQMAVSSTEVQCHDFEFPILGIGATHYFYVKSTSADCGTLQSAEGVFCVGNEIIVNVSGFSFNAMITSQLPKTISIDDSGFTTETDDTYFDEPISGLAGTAVVTSDTPKTISDSVSEFSTDTSNYTVA